MLLTVVVMVEMETTGGMEEEAEEAEVEVMLLWVMLEVLGVGVDVGTELDV